MNNTKLQRSAPESMGVPSKAILNFLEAVQSENHEMHSIMLVKGGNVIFERWWKPYGADHKHQLHSLSKSFTSIAVGMAVDEGLLTEDTTLAEIFKTEVEHLGSRMDEEVPGMTIKNLLTMSTGMEYEPWDFNDLMPIGMEATRWNVSGGNNIINFLSAHIKDTPGKTFRYSSIATYMCSAAITRLTGQTLVEYLQPRLFEPLGMTNFYWELDKKAGVSLGGFGLNATTEDIAKFGQLLLQKGKWGEKQLVSESWINKATQKQISNDDGTGDWSMGYGYQFWQCKPEGVYRGDGMFGQYCIVAPGQDLVIAATSNVDMQRVSDLFWTMLDDIKKLPADGSQAEELQAYKTTSHLKIDETGIDYPTMRVEYEIKDSFFDSISFDFAGNECVLSASIFGNVSTLLYVNKKWTKMVRTLLHFSAFGAMSRVATYGNWDGRVFAITNWFYETPCHDQIRFTFSPDFSEITIEHRTGEFNSPYEVRGIGKRK